MLLSTIFLANQTGNCTNCP